MSTGTPPLDLDLLGWRQFEDLCEQVLETVAGIGRDRWPRGDGEEHACVIREGVRLPGLPAFKAPTVVAIGWVRTERGAGVSEAGPMPSSDARDYNLVLRNVESPHSATAVVAGPAWISAQVDALPGLRRALPSLLSLAPIERWISDELRARSTLDVTRAYELAEVFVPTSAYRRALAVLDQHRFVVLTGAPEMGKTATARMLALAAMSDRVEAHECTDPDQLFELHDPERPQLFVADDAFGSTEYRVDAGDRWARAMERILGLLDDRHALVMTSRQAPLHAALRRIHREHGAEWFAAPGAVVSDVAALDLDERTLIVLRHGRRLSDGVRRRLRLVGYDLVCHPHFTPERMRRLATDGAAPLVEPNPELRWSLLERSLSRPTAAMSASLRALDGESRALLTALLDAPAGAIDHRHVGHIARLHHPEGFSRSPAEIVEQLAGHFLVLTEAHKIEWIHPSWRDVLIEELRADDGARRRFLKRCMLDGLLLALARGGGSGGERTLALLVRDEDWDVLTERCLEVVGDGSEHDVARLTLAIAEALQEQSGTDPQGRHDRAELHALAEAVLDAVARRARRAGRAIDLGLIGAWLSLAHGARIAPPAAAIAPTWTELQPAETPDLSNVEELDGALRWLELIDVLGIHAPDELAAFGFPQAHEKRIAALAAEAGRLLAAGDVGSSRPQLSQVLWRSVSVVSPARPELLHEVAMAVESEDTSDAMLDPGPHDAGVRRHVDRILADL